MLVSYDGAVKVTDFGIAKASARSTETIGGAMKGKIGYMSPEQCRGEPVDRRSDIFALGILLAELTTTQRLFWADNDFAVLNKVLRGDFESPSRTVSGYPPALEAIVLRALSAEREARHPTAGALLRDLESFTHDAHLRSTTATVADWMHMVFGNPPYPRVEMLPADDGDPLDAMPTLILAGDSMRGADPDAVTRYEPPLPTQVSEPAWDEPVDRPPRSRGAAVLASAAIGLLAIGGAGWWMMRGDATAGAAERATMPTEGPEPSPETSPVTSPEPERTEPAEAAVASDGPTGGDTPGSSTGDRAPTVPPTASPSADAAAPKKRRPRSKRRTKARPAGPGDIDALYPVKG